MVLIHTFVYMTEWVDCGDKVEDNDSCMAVNIVITSFIWKMSSEETPKRSSNVSKLCHFLSLENASDSCRFRKCNCL